MRWRCQQTWLLLLLLLPFWGSFFSFVIVAKNKTSIRFVSKLVACSFVLFTCSLNTFALASPPLSPLSLSLAASPSLSTLFLTWVFLFSMLLLLLARLEQAILIYVSSLT